MGLYCDLGKIFSTMKGLDVGLSYRMESKLDIDPFDTIAVVETGGIPLNLQLAIFDYYQPDSFTAGVSYKLGDKVVLSVDIEVQTWSEYEVSSRYALNFGDILPDLDDIVIPKIGVQYQNSDSTEFFFGYYFQPSFIPDDAVKGVVNWIDNDKHVLSIGMSHKTGKMGGFQNPMEISVGYQLQYLDERDIEKTSPTSMNPDYSVDGICHTIMVGIAF
jgi:long-chain fatty acid transport protein